MSNIQAALGLAQFERLDELIDRKREIFKIYKENLVDIPLYHLMKRQIGRIVFIG